MRLDAHQFFTPEHTPEHLAAILKRNRFDGSIAVARSAEETAWLVEQCARHSYLRGVIAHVDDPPDLAALAGLGNSVRGVTVRAGCPAGVFQELARLGLTADFDGDLAAIPSLASHLPELRIAIVHLGRPDGSARWARALEEAAAYPNVRCKASGLLALGGEAREAIRHALRIFGPARLMFGSDWPSCLPANIWKATLAAFTQAIGAQPIEVREELLGGAAARCYAIEDPSPENGYNEVSLK